MNRIRVLIAGWLVLWAGFGFPALADFQVAPVFTEHLVLQQGMPVPVWGWGDDGEELTVRLGRQ